MSSSRATDPGPRQMRRLPLLAASLAMVLIAIGGALWFARAGGDGGGPSIGGPFTLTDGAGREITDAAFRGKYVLVYFGYTFCPDVCPTTLTQVEDALGKLGPKAKRLQALFITVDPKRDTPAVVGAYAKAFGPGIEGLTGTPEQIARVAREYRVYYAEHRTGPGPGDYTMDHSSILYLMGPDGRFIAPIRADESGAEMAADIAGHMA